jgi:hypothetical protein
MEEIKLVIPYCGINRIIEQYSILLDFIRKNIDTIEYGCDKLGIEWDMSETTLNNTVIGVPKYGIARDIMILSYNNIKNTDRGFYSEDNLRGIISDIQMVLDATGGEDVECSFSILIVDKNKKVE